MSKTTKQRKFSRLEEAMGWELFLIHRPEVAKLQNTFEHSPIRWTREAVNAKSSYAQIRLKGYDVSFWVEKTPHGRTKQQVKVRVQTDKIDRKYDIYTQWDDDEGQSIGDLEDEASINGMLGFVDWFYKEWMLGRYGR